MKTAFRLLTVFVFAMSGFLPGVANTRFILPLSVEANEFETMMEKVRAEFAKSPSIDDALSKYNATNGSFTDIDYSKEDRTDWEPLTHIDRVYDFVFAYTNPGNKYYESEALYEKIVAALNYWYQRNPYCDNWWYNQIAEPQRIGVLLIQMRIGKQQIPADLENRTLQRMKTDGGNPADWTGANRTDIALHWIYRACLTADVTLLRNAINYVYNPVQYTTGEGFQHDNCYFQHGAQLYIGGYGDEILKGVTQVAMYTRGTQYALSEARLQLLSKFMRETYYQTIRGAYMLFDVLGRGVSRPSGTSKGSTSLYAERMMILDSEHAEEYAAIIERLGGRKSADYGVKPLHTHYFRGDYTLHVRPGYTFDVRTVSTRTMRCEYGNGENLKTYFMSDGCTNMVIKGNEYAGIFAMWDWARIPGVTAPQMKTIPQAVSDWQTRGTSKFAGGVSDSIYGATAYSYEDKYKNINTAARKAWFFFDDEVVCLGAGITSTATVPVNTTINQCTLVGGKATVSANGQVAEVAMGEYAYDNNLNWVWHNNIGYVFPDGGNVFLLNQNRSGSWYDINTTASKTVMKKNVFTLGFNHGQSPKDDTYAYIVVPNKSSAAEMAAYPMDNIEILANTDSMQVVRNKKLGVWEFIFYQGATFTHGELSVKVNKGCALLFKDIEKPSVQFHIADPAQTQSKINVEVHIPSVSLQTKSIECDFTGTGIYAGQSKVYTVDTNSPTGLQPVGTVSAVGLSVYPNPAAVNEPVSVVWEEGKLSSEDIGRIDFYTLAGTCVTSCEMNGGKASVSFDKSGLYIGRAQGKNPVNSIKVLVK
ncbi:polysaccharide lyase 8 family protein [Bacteroides sp. CG01]|uniref:polysaccharide lyase 8 family protein n=1 Tax=Bacteroides sp. CG01 TaxID=3096000 RepID=UPI002AFF80F6|nr:polysaccharide lyase 8 family protein [Bacteroides sp. CG01]